MGEQQRRPPHETREDKLRARERIEAQRRKDKKALKDARKEAEGESGK